MKYKVFELAEKAMSIIEREAREIKESHSVDGEWERFETGQFEISQITEQAKSEYDEMMSVAFDLRAMAGAIKNSAPFFNWEYDPLHKGYSPGESLSSLIAASNLLVSYLNDESKSKAQIEDIIIAMHHNMESFWRALASQRGWGYVEDVFKRYDESLKKRNANCAN